LRGRLVNVLLDQQGRPISLRQSQTAGRMGVRSWPAAGAPSREFIAATLTASLHLQRRLWSTGIEEPYDSCQATAVVHPAIVYGRRQPVPVADERSFPGNWIAIHLRAARAANLAWGWVSPRILPIRCKDSVA
jgi:hypothetical protein